MPRRNYLLPLAVVVGVLLFLGGLTRLLLMRYERGDVYPAYSTLRADPLGARVFFESIGSIPGYTAVRGFNYLHRELEKKALTMVYFGLSDADFSTFSDEELTQLDEFVRQGGRVIVTLEPEGTKSNLRDFHLPEKKKDADEKKDDTRKDDKKPAAKPSQDEPKGPQTEQEKFEREELRKEIEKAEKKHDDEMRSLKYRRSLNALWGFGTDQHSEDEEKKPEKTNYYSTDEDGKQIVLANHFYGDGLEDTVPWKSAAFFVRLDPAWETLYRARTKPVMIRRKLGKGEIILATDSYFISNEALRNDRRPALLSLLAGPPGRMLFDETHLGTQEQEGVMFLLEKFRLEGFLIGAIGVLGLFIWRNSVPLVPARVTGRNAALGGTVSGKDSRSGLVNLLRRNIPAAEILKTSFAEWRRTTSHSQPQTEERGAAMNAALTSTDAKRADEIVSLYHQLREINHPPRGQKTHATKS